MKNTFSLRPIFFAALIVLILQSQAAYSQLAVPFKVRYQSFIKGDMTLISNTIVNRSDNRNSSNEAYNDISENAKLNDEFTMAYIDIDNDESTFSSSSATLNLENSTSKKVKYAGLYWSATYKYDSGERDKKWNYVAIDKNRGSLNEIKLKLPGSSDYIDISGDVIFDGLNVVKFKESAPYAVYADVTKQIQSLVNPNGEYTVANIRATQGIISGGVAGGWTLFIVYEDETETGKFITSFDGFVGITTRPVEILYSGFSTLPEGKVNAKLAGSVLEGDRNLTGDQLEIKSVENPKYTLMEHPLKPGDNFFNSTIIIDDNYFENRNPNSLNTLGYDTFLIPINNENNAVIQNNSSQVSLKLKSTGDRYSMFFSAFNVEVKDPESEVEQLISSTETTSKIAKPSVSEMLANAMPSNGIQNEEETVAEITQTDSTQQTIANTTSEKKNSELTPEEIQAEMERLLANEAALAEVENVPFNSIRDMIKESEKVNAETVTTSAKKRITVLPGADVLIPNQQKGYYVVANVFAKPNNATRFEAKLKKQGLDAQILFNPTNNFQSVYIGKFGTWSDAIHFYYSNAEGKYFDELWIMLVNTSTGTILQP